MKIIYNISVLIGLIVVVCLIQDAFIGQEVNAMDETHNTLKRPPLPGDVSGAWSSPLKKWTGFSR